MSRDYKHGDKVPCDVLAARLNQLARAVTEGPDAVRREFTMRVPAELDRDADVVIWEASKRLPDLEADLARAVEEIRVLVARNDELLANERALIEKLSNAEDIAKLSIDKLGLVAGDLCVVQCPVPEQRGRVISFLREILPSETSILLCSCGFSLEKVPEKVLAQFGWFRLGDPVGYQAKFVTEGERGWASCSKLHHDLVLSSPADWQGYEVRAVYAQRTGPSSKKSDEAQSEAANIYNGEFWHDSDCVFTGCPGHNIKVEHFSVIDSFKARVDGEVIYQGDIGTTEALVKLLTEAADL